MTKYDNDLNGAFIRLAKIEHDVDKDTYPFNIPAVQAIESEETEHYKLTLDFLSNYKAYTARLFN